MIYVLMVNGKALASFLNRAEAIEAMWNFMQNGAKAGVIRRRG